MFLAQQDNQPFFSLAPLTEEHGIPVAVMGILVVFTVLVLVVIYISVLPHILAPLSGKKQDEATREPEVRSDELSPETLVVIAAAVSEAMGRPHRIVQIRGSADLGWSLEGRMQHHHSHKIQPRAGR